MDAIELIRNRRSCRIFKSTPVESAKIDILTKAALWSPTSKNNRSWEFVWVDDKEVLEKLSKCKPHGGEFLANTPLALVIFVDPTKSDAWVEDSSVVATLVQITAEDLGLGSCWIQVRLRHHDESLSANEYCKTLLNAPDHYEATCIIALGYKEKERNPYSDAQLQLDRVHRNSF